MTVAYTSYQAKVVESVIAMLAASTTWQGVVGAVSAAAARAYIIESWGGNPKVAGRAAVPKGYNADGTAFSLTPPFANVHVQAMPSRSIGVGYWEHNGQAFVSLILPRSINPETPPESFRRARNHCDGIRADFESMMGTTVNGTAALARFSIDLEGPELAAEEGADGDSFFALLTINYEG